MMLPLMTVPTRVVPKADLVEVLKAENPDTLITFGAGDIDRLCEPIAEALKDR